MAVSTVVNLRSSTPPEKASEAFRNEVHCDHIYIQRLWSLRVTVLTLFVLTAAWTELATKCTRGLKSSGQQSPFKCRLYILRTLQGCEAA